MWPVASLRGARQLYDAYNTSPFESIAPLAHQSTLPLADMEDSYNIDVEVFINALVCFTCRRAHNRDVCDLSVVRHTQTLQASQLGQSWNVSSTPGHR